MDWCFSYDLLKSGNSPEEVVVHKVSLALEKNLDVVGIPFPDYTDRSLQLLLEEDDMTPVDCAGNYIQSFFKKHLSEKNITLFLTGDGGVLHKDWEWMQDLRSITEERPI